MNDFFNINSQPDKLVPMMEASSFYYAKTAHTIKHLKNHRPDLVIPFFDNLLVEDGLMNYKICKISTVTPKQLITHFEISINKFNSLN